MAYNKKLINRDAYGAVKPGLKVGFGLAGTIFFGFLTFLFLILNGIFGRGILGVIIMLLLTAISLIYAYISGKDLASYTQSGYFERVIGNRTSISIDELATRLNKSPEEIRRQAKRMIKKKVFPFGRMDLNETMIFLDEKAYADFVAEEEAKMQAAAREQAMPDQLLKQLKSGEASLEMIRRNAAQIRDPGMRADLQKMEKTLQDIFDYVRKDPTSGGQMRRLTDYYLPTINKTLQAYIELDGKAVGNEEIRATKQEIEDAISTGNEAFDSILEKMIRDDTWDVRSEVSAMKTIMAADGLTEDEMAKQQLQSHKLG